MKRTDIELIGPTVKAGSDEGSVTLDLPGIKRIRINGVEVTAARISIDGDNGRGDGRPLTVTAVMYPSSLRFITAAEADHTDSGLDAHHRHDDAGRLREVEELLDHYNAPEGTPVERIRGLIRTAVDEAVQVQAELNGMHDRERQVDAVVAAWDVKRGGLNGYDKVGTLDPESPAGRVVELLRDLTKVRPMTTAILESRGAALNAIESNLGKYGLGRGEGDYPDIIVEAVSVALRDRADALQQLRTIDNALTMHADKRDPLTMALKHPADTAARVAEALSAALKVADDITKAADDAEREQREYNNPFPEPADIAGSDGYVAGLRAAAVIAAGDTPEADPNVAHIDTVNGRGAHAQRAEGHLEGGTHQAEPQESE